MRQLYERQEITQITEELAESTKQFEEKLKEYLQTSRNEIDFAAKVLENSSSKFEDTMNAQLDLLEKTVDALSKASFALRKLPDKLGDHLQQLIPNIAAQVQKMTFQDMDAALGNTGKAIEQLNSKIYQIIRKIEELNSGGFRKRLKSFALMLLIPTLASAGMTYTMLRYFPQRIMIDSKGNVNLPPALLHRFLLYCI